MHEESEKRLSALEKKQTEHEIAIERVVFIVDDMRKSVDEIKGYVKSAVGVFVVTSATIVISGIATLIWYGLKVAIQNPLLHP